MEEDREEEQPEIIQRKVKKPASISVKIPSREEFRSERNQKRQQSDPRLIARVSGLRVGSLLRIWAEVSRINYFSPQPLDVIALGRSSIRRSIGLLPKKELSIEGFVPFQLHHASIEDLFEEQFPINVTPLLNEDQLWGCYYTFPELYGDVYSPVVRIPEPEDVPELTAPAGVLTRDMVTTCLTYLKRTPILGDYVYIKLDLCSKHLINIDVLQYYKFLVYLDLSTNFLTSLSVLSYLPYLQYLSVAYNRLNTVLEYDTPQWFLTEVHYKYNSVKRIRDLSAFWSITILDLSHNNIKAISGLENLRYLRRLDLSFNHIQRLENLNNLRLLWLDVSYNNISSFEFGPLVGLWNLLDLEYLNLNENNLTSMKMFSGCVRLRELHVRNNRLNMLLELAVYLRQLRKLIILDLRANPICSLPGYKDVIINTFPILLNLDDKELDPVEQRTSKMEMTPDVKIFATRRLLRLLYIEQLSRAKVSPFIPPADTTEVPMVILVGYEGIGKGSLARRLANECSSHIEIGMQHTTAPYHSPGHYKEISRAKFDDMLLAGDFLTYTEIDGESYGLSREEGFIRDGKVRVACMDLASALMLQMRGRRPYLLLCTCINKTTSAKKQQLRKAFRNRANEQRFSMETPMMERSTLQVMLSGRIIITGIINEILLYLPEDKEESEFVIESECSLLMDSEARQAKRDSSKGVNLLTLLASSATSLEETCKRVQDRSSQQDPSMYSLYKESQGTGEYNSCATQNSYQEPKKTNNKKNSADLNQAQRSKEKGSSLFRPKSVDFSRYASSTWKGLSIMPDSAKSSKSVTFTATELENQLDPTGMLIEPPHASVHNKDHDKEGMMRSISTRLPRTTHGPSRHGSDDDLDLWLAFLADTGIMDPSDLAVQTSEQSPTHHDTKMDDPDMMLQQLSFYRKTSSQTFTTTVRDDYDGISQLCPGLFWDTVVMDNPDEAFLKVKKIICNIVNSQKTFTPMFDIDFTDLKYYPTVEKRLANISQQIAPQRLFY